MHETVKQGIDNCYMIHEYDVHPGYEADRCAGLYTMDGDGKPCEECQKCKLYYLNRR